MAKVLPRREAEAEARLDILEAGDGEVEQLEVPWLADTCIGGRVQDTLPADDSTLVAQGERPADVDQPRPVDLLFHPDREADRLLVAVEAGRRRAGLRRTAEPAKR